MDRWIVVGASFLAIVLPFGSKCTDTIISNGRVESALQLGIEHFSEGEYVEALVQFELANSIPDEAQSQNQKAEVNMWLGNAYQESAKYAKAREAYMRAIQIADEATDSVLVQRLNINLGILEANQERFRLAQKYLLKAVQFFTRTHDTIRLINASNSLGYAYLHDFKLDSAKVLLQSSLDLASTIGDSLRMAKIHVNLGSLYFTLVQQDIGGSHFKKAIQIFEALGAKELSRSIYFDLMRLYTLVSDQEKVAEIRSAYLSKFGDVRPEHQHQFDIATAISKNQGESQMPTDGSVYLIILGVVAVMSLLFNLWSVLSKKRQAKLTPSDSVVKDNVTDLQKVDSLTSPNNDDQRKQVIRHALKSLLDREARDRVNVLLTLFYVSKDPSKNTIAIELEVTNSTVTRYCTILESFLNTSDVRKFALNHKIDQLDLAEYKNILGIEN